MPCVLALYTLPRSPGRDAGSNLVAVSLRIGSKRHDRLPVSLLLPGGSYHPLRAILVPHGWHSTVSTVLSVRNSNDLLTTRTSCRPSQHRSLPNHGSCISRVSKIRIHSVSLPLSLSVVIVPSHRRDCTVRQKATTSQAPFYCHGCRGINNVYVKQQRSG